MSESVPTVLPITVVVLPFKDESDDFDTQTMAEEVAFAVKQGASAAGYTVYTATTETSPSRGSDFFQLLAQGILDNKEALGILMGSAVGAIGLLTKQRRVGEIEVTIDDKTIKLKDTDRVTAQKLIAQLDEEHPGSAKKLGANSKVQVTAKVSKRPKPKN